MLLTSIASTRDSIFRRGQDAVLARARLPGTRCSCIFRVQGRAGQRDFHPLASSSLLDIAERLIPLFFGRPTCFKSTLLMISDRFPLGSD